MPEQRHKPAKKAGKAPSNKGPHVSDRDAPRAYEHLGRIRVPLSSPNHDRKPLFGILELAIPTFQAGKYKHAAELFRAGEHFAFAELLREDGERVSPELRREIQHELTQLKKRVVERRGRSHKSPPPEACTEEAELDR